MTTNLVIAYPDIPFNASSHTLTGKSADSSYNKDNVINGFRSDRFQFVGTAGSPEHTFTLSSGQTAEYLIVSQANLLMKNAAQNSGTTNLYLGGSNGGGYTFPVNGTSWTTSDLVGINSQDYITTFAETSSYTTWLIQFCSNSSATNTYPHGQIYFGKFFDFLRDPLYGRRIEQDSDDVNFKGQATRFFFNYKGISDTVKIDFETKIGKFKDINPVFLYTRTSHNPILGRRLSHCIIVDYEFTPTAYQYNNLTIVFEELVS